MCYLIVSVTSVCRVLTPKQKLTKTSTDDENQNGKYICVRTYDDFITTSDGESLYSYDKLVVENIDTTDPTITDLSPKNSGTQVIILK